MEIEQTEIEFSVLTKYTFLGVLTTGIYLLTSCFSITQATQINSEKLIAPPVVISSQSLASAKALIEKPATWDKIPKSVTLCVYAPDGAGGKAFEYATSYLSQMPKFAETAKSIGLTLNATYKPPFKLHIDLASIKLKRTASTDVTFRLYSDERVAVEDFKINQCDGIAMSNIRGRAFNKFVGSIDAIGGINTEAQLTKVIELLAKPSMAKYMVNRDYEVTSIVPMGAGYVMVRDRKINSLAKAAGKKIAVLNFDKSQAQMVQRVGAQHVSAELSNISGLFNNGQVDIIAGPALLFEPLELHKGMDNIKNLAQPTGGIIRFPLLQVTGVMMMHRHKFPDGLGQLVREFSVGQLQTGYQFIKQVEGDIPAKYWVDIPDSDKAGYKKMMREARIDMTKAGFYDPEMMKLLKGVRCQSEPNHYECALTDE